MTIQELKEVVKKLSSQERILLVQYVLGTFIEDAQLSVEWEKELKRRSESYKKGQVETRSWVEVKERLMT